MLSRRTPMRRAGFKSRAPTAPARDPDRVRATPTVTPDAWRAPEQVITGASRIQKAALVRSEAYRRLVSSLPCVICGMPGYSQAAHGSEGKGMGIKAVRRELEPVWAADTRRKLLAMGLWPKGVPVPDD